MVEPLSPPSAGAPSSPSVDSIRKVSLPVSPVVLKYQRVILMGGGAVYGVYVLWLLILMAILPSTQVSLRVFVPVGTLTALLGVAGLGSIGALLFIRAWRSTVPAPIRTQGLIRAAVVIPGIVLGLMTPVMISREPSIGIVVSPSDPKELVAPLSVTLDVRKAVEVLQARGSTPILYRWDFDGDGKMNQETVLPTVTALYQRQGAYTVSVDIGMTDGTFRKLGRRLIIQQAVFSVSPIVPIIEETVVFSVAHLFSDIKQIKEVHWDLDGDGEVNEVTTAPRVSYTYFRSGKVTVSATVFLVNQAQERFERVIDVREPPPLPFPVAIKTQPEHLVGPAPFGVLFRVQSEEPLDQVLWNFGDGSEEETGERIAHTFKKEGVYSVSARIRSSAGVSIELATVVIVAEALQLPDLTFEGTPQVLNKKISAEVPVTINLKPRTQMPFVEFSWEAPEATEVGQTEGSLQAIYRREGVYTITLFAEDPDERVMRLPITLEVHAPSSIASIRMDPEGGIAPLSVQFDASETYVPGETITGFEWDFGDKSPKKFGGSRVEHTYILPGTYTVETTVRTTSGKESMTSRTITVRAPPLDACMFASRTSGSSPLGVSFSADCSSGDILTYLWDFGDNAQSDLQSPVHVFEHSGVYTVTLRLMDKTGQFAEATTVIQVK